MTEVPFLFLPNLKFDASALLEFVNGIPDDVWKGPHIGNYDPDVEVTSHIHDDMLWTANSLDYDFISNPHIKKISDYMSDADGNPYYKGMMIKKSKNGHEAPLHPLMQHEEWDKKRGWVRTWDVIIPIQGGFEEDPLRAFDTENSEWYTLTPRGQAYLVPTHPRWHYTWQENVYDHRITLHIRCFNEPTYAEILGLYATEIQA